jgi:GT2 family glycosyltransferase
VLFAPRDLPRLRPDVTGDPGPFSAWVRTRELGHPVAPPERQPQLLLRLILAIAGEPPPETLATLQSLQHQASTNWDLTVILDGAWRTSFTTVLAVSGLRRSSQKVRVHSTVGVTSEYQMLHQAMRMSAGHNIALIFPGDVWPENAIGLLSGHLSPRRVVYADEDCVTTTGEHGAPRLKPIYSPDFHLRFSYIGRPVAIGSEVTTSLAHLTEQECSEVEHDIALRACELADDVHHLPEVLCHRLIAPSGVSDTVAHIDSALERRRIPATVSRGPCADTYRIIHTPPAGLRASLIVPFRDEPQFLRTCVDSIERTSGAQQFELILINNGSTQPETATLLERLSEREQVRILEDDRPFNWAQLNNAAAEVATGDVLVFLNNDIEAHTAGWLATICAQAVRPDVGAVGARLLYPNRRLQHCGVVVGLGGAAGHILVGLDETDPGYLRMARTSRECGAVTGACLATNRQVFLQLNGFDESLGIDLNDIDYCLRAQRLGLRIMYEAEAELIHHESPSRGTAGDVRDIVRFIDRWKQSILDRDPYLNPRLTRMDASCALRGPGEDAWWHQWNEALARP